jgi:hypothetical protein
VDQSATVYRQMSNTNTIDYISSTIDSSGSIFYILTFISILTSSTILMFLFSTKQRNQLYIENTYTYKWGICVWVEQNFFFLFYLTTITACHTSSFSYSSAFQSSYNLIVYQRPSCIWKGKQAILKAMICQLMKEKRRDEMRPGFHPCCLCIIVKR